MFLGKSSDNIFDGLFDGIFDEEVEDGAGDIDEAE